MLSSLGAGNDHQHTDTFSYNSATGKVENISGFRYSFLSFNKSMLTDAEDNFYKSFDYDGLGRLKAVKVGLQRKQMLAYDLVYDSVGRIKSKSTQNHEGRPAEENYSYKNSNELAKIWGPENFEFDHDENGNLARVRSSQGEEVLTYDLGDRVEKITAQSENFKVTYDPISGSVSGVTSDKRKRKYWHDARGKLVQIVDTNSRTSYQYDYKGRLVAFIQVQNGGRRPADKTVMQFFYADPSFPERVTHVQSPKSGLTQRLIYDHEGQLVCVQTKDQKFYVATDNLGSPLLIFRPDGTIDKEIKYSAFGHVLQDSSPAFFLPVGYMGGLIIGPGLVLINQRIYDVQIRQWLNPDWENLQQPLSDPSDLFVYRFFKNNPINIKEPLTYSQVSSLNFWASLYGYDIEAMMNRPFIKIEEEKATNLVDLNLASGLIEAMKRSQEILKEISFVPVPKFVERLKFPTFASSSGLCEGLLLTAANNHLVDANVIEGTKGVVQTIFLSVLNGTKFLDEISYINSAQKSYYYFAKRTGTSSDIAEALMSSDMDSVNRLAGQFKVEVEPLKQRGKALIIENDHLKLTVLYSDSPSIANFVEDVLHEAADLSMSSAWLRERNLVQAGFTGYGDWTQSQQNELINLRPGMKNLSGVRGYEAVEIQPHIKYPHLVRDESNYGFVSETLQQRRRKNRHGKSRKYA